MRLLPSIAFAGQHLQNPHTSIALSLCCCLYLLSCSALQAAHDRDADVQTWWLELGQARSRLQQTGRQWHAELHTLLSSWALLRKRSVQHVFDELQATLDMNGYFSRLAGPA